MGLLSAPGQGGGGSSPLDYKDRRLKKWNSRPHVGDQAAAMPIPKPYTPPVTSTRPKPPPRPGINPRTGLPFVDYPPPNRRGR